MSVIVKGMEMPENCHVCGLCFGGLCYAKPPEVDEMCPDEDRPDWCPLRPLPKNHGRLIDAEALENIIGKLSTSWEYGQGVSDCWDALIDSPTIVVAEGD